MNKSLISIIRADPSFWEFNYPWPSSLAGLGQAYRMKKQELKSIQVEATGGIISYWLLTILMLVA